MKVVFLEEVEGTARIGEVKNVAGGFARNYLLPRRLAAPATEHYINIAQAKAEKEARRQTRLDEEAQQYLLPKVEGSAVTIEVRVGEQGKLFGSVTGRDIAEAVQEATGVEMEHRQVHLREPIRELGSHEVTVKLTRNVETQVTVNVEPLGGLPAPEEAETVEEPEQEVAEAEAVESEPEAVAQPEPEEAESEPEAEAATEEDEAEGRAKQSEAEAVAQSEPEEAESEAEAEAATEEDQAEGRAEQKEGEPESGDEKD